MKTKVLPLSSKPTKETICPECGAKGGFITAVDVTCYSGQYIQFTSDFTEGEEPSSQAIRVYCQDCGFYHPISDSLAELLASEV